MTEVRNDSQKTNTDEQVHNIFQLRTYAFINFIN